jgi:hypothetical protein
MAAKLAQMKAERDRQDGMWTQPLEEKMPAPPAKPLRQGARGNSTSY